MLPSERPNDSIYLFSARGKDVYWSYEYWAQSEYDYPVNPIEDLHIGAFVFAIFCYWILHIIFRSFLRKLAKKYVIHNSGAHKLGMTPNYDDVTEQELFKFESAGWRFFNYTLNFCLGINAIYGQAWVSDPGYCDLWPHIPFPFEMRLLYLCTAASYTYSSICLFIEPKQKDFWQMLLHHIVTILEVTVSWYCGYVRIGALVIILTDIADPFMEMAKCMLYTGNVKLADFFFTVFGIVFLITRNFIYPFYILYSSVFHGFNEDGYLWKSYLYFATGLWILQGLFMFWGFLVIKLALGMYLTGEDRGDIRDEDRDEKVNDLPN